MMPGKRQACLDLEFQTDYRETVFHVGPCNVEAYNWLIRWPSEFRAQFACIYGPSGSGKTHLSHIWAQRHGCVWITPELMTFPVQEIVQKGDYFILDNADRAKDETWLFHFFNAIQATEHKFWLLTAEKQPSRWSIVLPDLRSRLNLCQTLGLYLPDDLTCLAVFNKIMRNKGVALKARYVHYILSRIDRSYTSIFTWAQVFENLLKSDQEINFSIINQLLQKH
jgi:chromosomal replication initiation ATPase DnaA